MSTLTRDRLVTKKSGSRGKNVTDLNRTRGKMSNADAEQVRGGRAGADKLKYMEYKMTDIIVTSIHPSGSGDGRT